jgi:hypothetical protein
MTAVSKSNTSPDWLTLATGITCELAAAGLALAPEPTGGTKYAAVSMAALGGVMMEKSHTGPVIADKATKFLHGVGHFLHIRP